MSYSKKPWQKTNKSEVKAYKPKRGILKPLLTDDQKQTANIQDLSYDFSCRIIRLFQYLTEDADYKEHIMSKQVYRSAPPLVLTSEKPNILNLMRTSSARCPSLLRKPMKQITGLVSFTTMAIWTKANMIR